MDWARDFLGNDVPAWQGGFSVYGLWCPTCGAPVFRRAGQERRPHFAHLSRRANPECENYFPSTGQASTSGNTSNFRTSQTWRERSSLNCGLFLGDVSDEESPLKLWLRVPAVDVKSTQAGNLRIQTGLGFRSYEIEELNGTRLIPLRPQTPIGNCTGTGSLLPLASRIAAELDAFKHDRNLFYAEERGGRLVFQNEAIEMGSYYRLLSNTIIQPPSLLHEQLGWKPCPKLADWYVYEFSLPSVFVASKPEVRTQISEFLGRQIRTSRPRLFLIYPAPHHIDYDGTYVYPTMPTELLLRRSAPKKVVITGLHESSPYVISELSDQWVQLKRISSEKTDCIVSIDDDEQFVFRSESCELFRPVGVMVHCGEHSWDLLSQPPIDGTELFHQEVHIECHTEKIAEYIAKLNPAWNYETPLILTKKINSDKMLRAGNFGFLPTSENATALFPEALDECASGKTGAIAARIWVEGLVIAAFGQEGFNRIRRYLADPIQDDVCHLGPLLGSPLIPYIRAAHGRKHGT